MRYRRAPLEESDREPPGSHFALVVDKAEVSRSEREAAARDDRPGRTSPLGEGASPVAACSLASRSAIRAWRESVEVALERKLRSGRTDRGVSDRVPHLDEVGVEETHLLPSTTQMQSLPMLMHVSHVGRALLQRRLPFLQLWQEEREELVQEGGRATRAVLTPRKRQGTSLARSPFYGRPRTRKQSVQLACGEASGEE